MIRVISKLRLVAGVGFVALATTVGVSAKSFGEWSIPASIESLPGSSQTLNTGAVDGCASHSKDGLTLAFTSNRTGNFDIYIATRSNISEGFGDPIPLPAPINETSSNEACPTLANGKRLYFSSDRDDSAYDIYVTRHGPKGWSAPTRLGPNINKPGELDETPTFYEDDQGREVMIFTRRVGANGKLWQSIDGGPATLVQGGPHSSASDLRASVTHDGRTLFWDSNRGGAQFPDIYYATRSNTSQEWGQAIRLPELSSPGQDLRPYISWDGTFLTMGSNRASSTSTAPDIWFATRSRQTGQ